MKANTLVTHKKLSSLGIGCVAKELKASCKVNFGTHNVITCKKEMLVEVDVSKTKTVPFEKFKHRILQAVSSFNICIVGNELKEFVGIYWITKRVVTLDDLKTYPRVV